MHLPTRLAVEEEAAAAQVPGLGIGHDQRDRGRHGGVHRVSATAQDLHADLGGLPLRRDDDPARAAERGAARGGGAPSGQRQEEAEHGEGAEPAA